MVIYPASLSLGQCSGRTRMEDMLEGKFAAPGGLLGVHVVSDAAKQESWEC